jgi:hypothetical protein
MDGKILSSGCIHFAEPSLRKKKSKTSFKKTTRKKKPLEDIFANIDNIDEKMEHCLQLAEDTFNNKTCHEEFSNPWALSPIELEQDQAFIRYLEELDKPISEDELADWSNDIDLFMEGLTNPNKLEALWEQSKAKMLWDELQDKSSVRLDRYSSEIHLVEDSVPIEDYMNRWSNVIQTPNSPTPQENHHIPHATRRLCSPEEHDNLDKYNKFINEFSVLIEGGWSPADTIPYDEDLLRHTLGLSPRVKSNEDFYPDSDQITKQFVSDRKRESTRS